MRPAGTVWLAALLLVPWAACTDQPDDRQPRVGSLPAGWDEEAPAQSELATQSYYVLGQSSSFLVKGASYARYLMRVDRAFDGVELFFTSTNSQAPGVKKPNVKDDRFHYEFMQIRPLGKTVRVMDVSAQPAFSNANTGGTFTLAYIYGKGANYQYLAPYQGDPGNWRLEAGFYELVIATDENLTVGVNVKLGTPLWSTFYHPQELGSSHAEALQTFVRVFPGVAPNRLDQFFDEVIEARQGENLNYFAFSNLIYRSNVVAVGTRGTVEVSVDDERVSHRLEATGVNPSQPQRAEAFAYAVSFAEPGPIRHEVKTLLSFEETASIDSDLAAQMLLFAVATRPTQTLEGLPTAPP